MHVSGNEMAKDASDKDRGITKTINRHAEKKRMERLAREAKQKRGR